MPRARRHGGTEYAGVPVFPEPGRNRFKIIEFSWGATVRNIPQIPLTVRNIPRITLEQVQGANAGTSSGSATKEPGTHIETAAGS